MRGHKSRESGMCHACRTNQVRPTRQKGLGDNVVPVEWPCYILQRNKTTPATVLDPAVPWHAEAIAQAHQDIHDAIATARGRGHSMTLAIMDVDPGTWLALCRTCGGYVVVDPIESQEPYGLAYTRDCPHTMYQPAKRRELLDYAPATAYASREPADRDPMYILED